MSFETGAKAAAKAAMAAAKAAAKAAASQGLSLLSIFLLGGQNYTCRTSANAEAKEGIVKAEETIGMPHMRRFPENTIYRDRQKGVAVC